MAVLLAASSLCHARPRVGSSKSCRGSVFANSIGVSSSGSRAKSPFIGGGSWDPSNVGDGDGVSGSGGAVEHVAVSLSAFCVSATTLCRCSTFSSSSAASSTEMPHTPARVRTLALIPPRVALALPPPRGVVAVPAACTSLVAGVAAVAVVAGVPGVGVGVAAVCVGGVSVVVAARSEAVSSGARSA